MSDERTAETPPGTPGQRALGAMESAVRRARESAGTHPLSPPPLSGAQASTRRVEVAPPREGPRPPAPLGEARPPAPPGEAARPARPDRWLIGAVTVVAVLVVAAAIALIVSLSGSSAPPFSTAVPVHPSTVPPAKTRSKAAPGSTSTSTSTVTVAPGGPPVISSLSPSSGAAGQSIVVAGANFLSTSGQIVATFNGQVAPTSCPAQNTCTITAPASTSPSVQVVITTSAGTSNAVTFTYG